MVFATEQGQARSGIWVGWLDRTQPPRQLTFGGEYRAFFGRPGQILYQGTANIHRRSCVSTKTAAARSRSRTFDIMQLQSVSPDGRWALVGVTPPGGHGDRNAMADAVPLEGGAPITVCDTCAFGFGATRSSAPLLSWSLDGKWVYVSLRHFPFGSSKTAVIPIKSGAAPPTFTKGFGSEADFARIPGARLINQDNVSSGHVAELLRHYAPFGEGQPLPHLSRRAIDALALCLGLHVRTSAALHSQRSDRAGPMAAGPRLAAFRIEFEPAQAITINIDQ